MSSLITFIGVYLPCPFLLKYRSDKCIRIISPYLLQHILFSLRLKNVFPLFKSATKLPYLQILKKLLFTLLFTESEFFVRLSLARWCILRTNHFLFAPPLLSFLGFRLYLVRNHRFLYPPCRLIFFRRIPTSLLPTLVSYL